MGEGSLTRPGGDQVRLPGVGGVGGVVFFSPLGGGLLTPPSGQPQASQVGVGVSRPRHIESIVVKERNVGVGDANL